MKKILVIDDSSTNVLLVEAVLQKHDFSVLTACNATEAFEILESDTPDLILLDILMPEINGFAFLEKMRADERFAHLPVMILSAVNNQEYKHKAKEMGAINYLTKPLDVDDILQKIRNFFNK